MLGANSQSPITFLRDLSFHGVIVIDKLNTVISNICMTLSVFHAFILVFTHHAQQRESHKEKKSLFP